MFHTLQARLTAGFVTIIALAVIAVSVSISLLYARVLYNQYTATYRSNANSVFASVDDRLRLTVLQQASKGDAIDLAGNNLTSFVQGLSDNAHVRIHIYSILDNRVVADVADVAGARGTASHLAPDELGPLPSYAVAMPLKFQGRQPMASIAVLTVSQPLTDRAYQQRQFEMRVAWITLGALLLAFVLGGVLSERLTAPFRTLTRATARIGAGNLHERVPEGRGRAGRRDEAGELAHQFNRMAQRLEESFALVSAERDRAALDRDHLRQFVADVAHELRTPLTALHTFNDLLCDGAGDIPEARREFLGESAQQIERLEWLTRNLLDLSRLETGITRIDAHPSDLGETLRRAVATNRPAAAARGVALTLDAAPLVVEHDAPRIEQALSNIVNNAVKFSPPGATVRARLYVDAGQAVVEVRDEGPGIPRDELPRVFERFYRGRDANRGGEGSGLGLAITKAIVDAHDGAIAVDSAPGEGTVVRLCLPHAVSAAPMPVP